MRSSQCLPDKKYLICEHIHFVEIFVEHFLNEDICKVNFLQIKVKVGNGHVRHVCRTFTKRHEDTHRKDSTSLWVQKKKTELKKIAQNILLKKHWFHAFF